MNMHMRMNQFLWMPVTLLLLGSCSGKEEKASPKVLVKTEKAVGHAAGSEWEMRFRHPDLIFLDIHLTDGDAFDRAMPYGKSRIKVKVHPAFKSDILISEEKASAFKLWLNY